MYPASVLSAPSIAAHTLNMLLCLIYFSIALVLLRPGQIAAFDSKTGRQAWISVDGSGNSIGF
ncbi:MAG TPA: hypothetical protein VFA09_20735 [Ktedonobacteraceae bacterium]|jgi:hypothetical protein|nr:hypothetical protein [Ktedonobacteraceae bacterium]